MISLKKMAITMMNKKNNFVIINYGLLFDNPFFICYDINIEIKNRRRNMKIFKYFVDLIYRVLCIPSWLIFIIFIKFWYVTWTLLFLQKDILTTNISNIYISILYLKNDILNIFYLNFDLYYTTYIYFFIVLYILALIFIKLLIRRIESDEFNQRVFHCYQK